MPFLAARILPPELIRALAIAQHEQPLPYKIALNIPMNQQDQMKQAVAQAALEYILPQLDSNTVLGIGTGSTANFFIDLLQEHKDTFCSSVASSKATAERLWKHGIPVRDLNEVTEIDIYIDGADETNTHLELIKGGGAALTREKIVASASREFVCIVDESKWVETLGTFPLPVEVIPTATNVVSNALSQLGGTPTVRRDVITDNGNIIIDVAGLTIKEPAELETTINQIVGVVTNGLFARRKADVLLMAKEGSVEKILPSL